MIEWARKHIGPTTKGFLLAAAFFGILLYGLNLEDRKEALSACDRGNERVAVTYDFLRGAENARRTASNLPNADPAQASNDADTADTYEELADRLVAGTKPELREDPSRPEVDCNAAYPLPAPLSWFS